MLLILIKIYEEDSGMLISTSQVETLPKRLFKKFIQANLNNLRLVEQ